MILVVDVGNTNMTLGVYREKELLATFRITTKTARTSDEYGVLITQMFSVRLLVRHDRNKRKYLYDVLRTKKETSKPLEQ